MKALIFALFLVSTAAVAEDGRQLVRLPPPAQEALRQDMHGIGMDGHQAASEFAAVARTGDRDKALALLPNLTSACVACHFSFRTR